METEVIKHFNKLGIDIKKETVLFALSDTAYNFEFDDESIIYEGTKAQRLPFGSLLIEFANMRGKEGGDYLTLKSNLDELNLKFPNHSKEHYIALFKLLRQKYSAIAARILTLEYYRMAGAYPSSTDCFLLELDFNSYECAYYISKGVFSKNKPNVTISAHFVPHDTDNTFELYYESYSLESLVVLDVYLAGKNDIKPKRCALCGKAFLPVSRSDEIYCRNIYKNGRTCSQMAFGVKSKNNPFYSEYRKAYKTMKARAARADGNTKLQEKTKKWSIEASAKLIEYEQRGDINGYHKWIEQSKKIY